MKKILLFGLISSFFIGCSCNKTDDKIEKLEAKITKLSNEIISIRNNKHLQQEINSLKKEIETLKKRKYKIINTTIIEYNDSILKEDLKTLKKKLNKIEHNIKPIGDYIVISPTTFMTISNSYIYNKPSFKSKKLFKFKKLTPFTSYKEKNGFVKITGYFIDKKWTPNKKEWWIPKQNITIKRKK